MFFDTLAQLTPKLCRSEVSCLQRWRRCVQWRKCLRISAPRTIQRATSLPSKSRWATEAYIQPFPNCFNTFIPTISPPFLSLSTFLYSLCLYIYECLEVDFDIWYYQLLHPNVCVCVCMCVCVCVCMYVCMCVLNPISNISSGFLENHFWERVNFLSIL